jgi:hypothetical protein
MWAFDGDVDERFGAVLRDDPYHPEGAAGVLASAALRVMRTRSVYEVRARV